MTHDSHVVRTATVKNLFDSSLAGDTKQRIMELHHHSQRLWGNMTVAQTLAHCTSGLEMAMGVINPKRAPFPANVMGLLIKPLVFGNDKPMRRNSPSSPELFSANRSHCCHRLLRYRKLRRSASATRGRTPSRRATHLPEHRSEARC